MISKLLDALYTKVFINIVVENHTSFVYIEICSQNSVVDSVERTFETSGLNSSMYEFIKTYIKTSPFYYISILDKSPTQGAIPTCTDAEMRRYVDVVDPIKTICSPSDWSMYTSEQELTSMQMEYKTIGFDFIFSPFSILSRFFEDKIANNLAIYALVQENVISLAVFDNSKLLYADYLDINKEVDDDILIDSSLDDDDDLLADVDDIDLDSIESGFDDDDDDDFGDIEDLDSTDDIDTFAEAADIQEIQSDSYEAELEEGFNLDYSRFSLIHNSINSFYKDKKYESVFLENIYICDAIGVSKDLKKYLEEEMFLSVVIRKINLCTQVCEMAKAELL